jgi:hypothetical protein
MVMGGAVAVDGGREWSRPQVYSAMTQVNGSIQAQWRIARTAAKSLMIHPTRRWRSAGGFRAKRADRHRWTR